MRIVAGWQRWEHLVGHHDELTDIASLGELLVALLCLNFGILFFDRNALNFLMPYVQPELHLSYTQVGLLGSGLSFTWALAAALVGWLSGRSERHAAAFADPARLRAAVDGTLASLDAPIEGAREVALFPPVTGG